MNPLDILARLRSLGVKADKRFTKFANGKVR